MRVCASIWSGVLESTQAYIFDAVPNDHVALCCTVPEDLWPKICTAFVLYIVQRRTASHRVEDEA